MFWVYLPLTLILISSCHVRAKALIDEALMDEDEMQQVRFLENHDVEELVKNIEGCFTQAPKSEEEFNLRCVEFISTIHRCWKTTVIIMSPAPDPQERLFSNFYLDVFNSSGEQQCRRGAGHVKELVENLKKSECLPLAATLKEKCKAEFRLLQELQASNFVLRSFNSNRCGDLAKAKDCVVGVLKQRCKDDVVGDFLEDALEAHLTSCSRV